MTAEQEPVPVRIARYRAFAEDARRDAESTRSYDMRCAFTRVAEGWDGLASELENLKLPPLGFQFPLT